MSSRYGRPPDSAPRPFECSDACGAGGSSAPRKSEMSSMSASSRATPPSGSTCRGSSSVRSNTAAPRPSRSFACRGTGRPSRAR
eukprot:5097087-Alexandrium_andersonii.AAC.1